MIRGERTRIAANYRMIILIDDITENFNSPYVNILYPNNLVKTPSAQ